MKYIQSIAVVGATGMLGSKVTRVLKTEGYSVTAVVRNMQKAQQIFGSAGIHLRKGDLRHKTSLHTAFQDSDFLYLNLSTGPDERNSDFKTEIDGVKNVIEAARKTGIRRIGYLSSLVKDYTQSNWWVFDYKREAVRLLLECDIPVTIFYPSNFYENIPELQMMGKRILLAGDQVTKSWWIGTRDYGSMVAEAFRQEHQENREYPVQGPEPFSMEEAADQFIRYYKPANLKKLKTPMWVFKALKPFSKTVDFQYNILHAINHYDEKFISENTWNELGKPQQTLKDFAGSIK
jgi:uncharacterized protein YbjT (DUF2867 family)